MRGAIFTSGFCYALITAVMLLGSAVSSAGVYRWTDAQGRIHYGDRPPDADAATPLTIRRSPDATQQHTPAVLDAAERRQRQQKLLDAYADERKQKLSQQQQRREQQRQRQLRCLQARGQLENYQRAGGIYDLNADGSRHYYSSQERQAALNRAAQAVKQWCD